MSTETDLLGASPNNSPHKCLVCGAPANSPAYKRYCWDHYYQNTDGKEFD